MSILACLENQLFTLNTEAIVLQNGYTEDLESYAGAQVFGTLMPVRSVLFKLDGTQEEKGIYQVDIYAQADYGHKKIESIADAIVTLFKNQTLTDGTSTVYIQAVSRTRIMRVEAMTKTFIEVQYLAYE